MNRAVVASWFLSLISACSLSAARPAQDPPPEAGTSWAPVGSFAALSVTDARGSSAWYRDKLGFTVLREGGSPDGSVRFALLRRENHLLEIVQRSNATAPPAMADRSYQIGLFKLGFWVDRLERLEEQLRQQGVRFSHGIVTPPGSDYRTFAVHDPEGNIVQFFGR